MTTTAVMDESMITASRSAFASSPVLGWRYDDDGNMTEWYARLREQMDYGDEGAYTDIR